MYIWHEWRRYFRGWWPVMREERAHLALPFPVEDGLVAGPYPKTIASRAAGADQQRDSRPSAEPWRGGPLSLADHRAAVAPWYNIES